MFSIFNKWTVWIGVVTIIVLVIKSMTNDFRTLEIDNTRLELDNSNLKATNEIMENDRTITDELDRNLTARNAEYDEAFIRNVKTLGLDTSAEASINAIYDMYKEVSR